MAMVERMSQLLRDKKELCLFYEEKTRAMVGQKLKEPEELEKLEQTLADREELIGRIDEIDRELLSCRDDSEEGRTLYAAARNECDYETLSAEGKQLFAEGQEIYKVLSRVQEMEGEIRREMESVMETLVLKIRQSNTNNRFTGYLKQMDYGESKGLLYNKKR